MNEQNASTLTDRESFPASNLETFAEESIKPRIGFLGLGSIGRQRMASLIGSGAIDASALVEPDPDCREAALAKAPEIFVCESMESLLSQGLDGIVIATPSDLHAAHAEAALQTGHAVFCQKPLGRTAPETARIVETACRVDKLLGVDLNYRYMQGTQLARRLIDSGELGEIYSVDLVFHNAYGPDKPWFYDRALSGGGCLIDLGIHLIDLALWLFPGARPENISGTLLTRGLPHKPYGGAAHGEVEDFAAAQFDLTDGPHVRLACSWRLPAGCDSVIQANFYGTGGGLAIRNVNGSFHDFQTTRFRGTVSEVVQTPPDDWEGRAAQNWASRLARDEGFDPEARSITATAAVIDVIYGRR